MNSNASWQPRHERLAVTKLADDPLAFNVKAEALRLLAIIIAARPYPFYQEGFARIADRVWVERTSDDGVGRDVCFQFIFDPFDGVEKGTLKTLTLRAPVKADVVIDCDLLTTDQDDLFWWSMWLADFRCSILLNNNDVIHP